MDIRQVCATSSGTLAGLTGYSKYGQTDIIQNRWVQFELDNPTDTVWDWRQSWTRFSSSDSYIAARAEAEKEQRS